MELKKCACCKLIKPISEYYKCKKYKDGLYCYCKTCDTQKSIKWKKSLGAEKYKEYRRRNAKKLDVTKYYPIRKLERMRYPEKVIARTASINIETKKGFDKHHWSYNKEHWLDIIYLSRADHMTVHRYTIYDQERMMYRNLNGVLLDTKEEYLNYINTLQFNHFC